MVYCRAPHDLRVCALGGKSLITPTANLRDMSFTALSPSRALST